MASTFLPSSPKKKGFLVILLVSFNHLFLEKERALPCQLETYLLYVDAVDRRREFSPVFGYIPTPYFSPRLEHFFWSEPDASTSSDVLWYPPPPPLSLSPNPFVLSLLNQSPSTPPSRAVSFSRCCLIDELPMPPRQFLFRVRRRGWVFRPDQVNFLLFIVSVVSSSSCTSFLNNRFPIAVPLLWPRSGLASFTPGHCSDGFFGHPMPIFLSANTQS